MRVWGLLILAASLALVDAIPLPAAQRNRRGGAPLHLSEPLRRGEPWKRLQDASKVVLGNITSFAGFFTVDVAKASNMFFWHFPALDGNEKAPLLIWLQGGPGASSMFSLFHEIGPYELTRDGKGKHGEIKLTERALTWNQKYSLLFIDNPVGAGFSYTKSADGYPQTEEAVAENLLTLLQQFYLVFPSLSRVPLYLTGESYAGHYIPAFGNLIHSHNAPLTDSSPSFIPLRGLAIGDGWIDPINVSAGDLGGEGLGVVFV
jgi:vitellogenic carboxypeptidase-like protein